MQIQIDTPTADEIPLALELLLQSIANEEAATHAEAIRLSAVRGEVSLDGLRVARSNGNVVGAVMGICQPDGTAHVWPPRLTAEAPESLDLELARTCRAWVDSSGATIAQCLTPLDDHASQQLLEQVGFERLTDLTCWEHDLDQFPHAPLPEDCEIVLYSDANSGQFERVMEQTYDGSVDCAALRGRRTARDSLAAHLLASTPELRLWQLYQCAAEAVGVVLCANHPDQRMWELLYLGVVTKFRQQGFGLAMVCDALWNAREAGAEGMFLAADDANEAAANLYAACGFSVAFRQRIHVCFPARPPAG